MSKEIQESQERNDQLKTTCDNIVYAFDKCSLELIKQMANPNSQLKETRHFFAEITLRDSSNFGLEDCGENFLKSNQYGFHVRPCVWKSKYNSPHTIVLTGILPISIFPPCIEIKYISHQEIEPKTQGSSLHQITFF